MGFLGHIFVFSFCLLKFVIQGFSVTNKTVACTRSSMTVFLKFEEEFNGIVFTKNDFSKQDCKVLGNGENYINLKIPLNTDEDEEPFCGVTDLGNLKYNADIIISGLQYVLVAGLKEFSVQCQYEEETVLITSIPGVTNKLLVLLPEVDVTDVISGNYQSAEVELPTDLRLTIREGHGYTGAYAKQAYVGAEITLDVSFEDGGDAYEMFIYNCNAHDGKGKKTGNVTLVDENGCGVELAQITKPPLETVVDDDGIKHIYLPLYGFRFTSSDYVLFECQVKPCFSECDSISQCSESESESENDVKVLANSEGDTGTAQKTERLTDTTTAPVLTTTGSNEEEKDDGADKSQQSSSSQAKGTAGKAETGTNNVSNTSTDGEATIKNATLSSSTQNDSVKSNMKQQYTEESLTEAHEDTQERTHDQVKSSTINGTVNQNNGTVNGSSGYTTGGQSNIGTDTEKGVGTTGTTDVGISQGSSVDADSQTANSNGSVEQKLAQSTKDASSGQQTGSKGTSITSQGSSVDNSGSAATSNGTSQESSSQSKQQNSSSELYSKTEVSSSQGSSSQQTGGKDTSDTSQDSSSSQGSSSQQTGGKYTSDTSQGSSLDSNSKTAATSNGTQEENSMQSKKQDSISEKTSSQNTISVSNASNSETSKASSTTKTETATETKTEKNVSVSSTSTVRESSSSSKLTSGSNETASSAQETNTDNMNASSSTKQSSQESSKRSNESSKSTVQSYETATLPSEVWQSNDESEYISKELDAYLDEDSADDITLHLQSDKVKVRELAEATDGSASETSEQKITYKLSKPSTRNREERKPRRRRTWDQELSEIPDGFSQNRQNALLTDMLSYRKSASRRTRAANQTSSNLDKPARTADDRPLGGHWNFQPFVSHTIDTESLQRQEGSQLALRFELTKTSTEFPESPVKSIIRPVQMQVPNSGTTETITTTTTTVKPNAPKKTGSIKAPSTSANGGSRSQLHRIVFDSRNKNVQLVSSGQFVIPAAAPQKRSENFRQNSKHPRVHFRSHAIRRRIARNVDQLKNYLVKCSRRNEPCSFKLQLGMKIELPAMVEEDIKDTVNNKNTSWNNLPGRPMLLAGILLILSALLVAWVKSKQKKVVS